MDILIDILKGAGSIILALIPLLIPQVREFIIKRYQLSLDKALEDKKASNERKNYVSKVRFDKEFEIYTELSCKTIDAVFSSCEIISFFNKNLSIYDFTQNRDMIIAKYNAANTLLQKYAPFITETIYTEYYHLFTTFRELIQHFETWTYGKSKCNGEESKVKVIMGQSYTEQFQSKSDLKEKEYTLDELKSKVIQIQLQLLEESDVLLVKLREHLEKRDVIY